MNYHAKSITIIIITRKLSKEFLFILIKGLLYISHIDIRILI